MARMQRSLFAQLNALAEEISSNSEKAAAAAKQASPTPADPGGYQGASTHPSAHVDNDGQKATTGARASEYEADIKKQQGALAVDNTPEMSQEGRQDEVQTNIGTTVAATGEDPAAEKDYKGTKDDPGTSHPAKANDGEKYSAVTFKEAHTRCSSLGNEILADLINFGEKQLTEEKAAGEMPEFIQKKINEKKEAPAEAKSEHGELKGDQHKLDVNDNGKIEGSDLAALRNGKEAAFAAGYELAAQLGIDKQAAEASVRDVCASTLREADELANLFIGYYSTKMAGADPTEEATEGEDHAAPSDAESGEAGPAAPAGDAGGLEAMLAGEGAEGPGLEQAPPSEEEALQELAMALQELGIPPEALVQGLAGGDAAGAEMPAPKMAAAADLKTIGEAVLDWQLRGNFQIKEARTKRSRQLRDYMKNHVRELVSR